MIRIVKLLIWIIVIGGGIFYYNYSSFKYEKFLEENKEIVIEKGETFRSLSDKIDGLDNFNLKLYLKYNIPAFDLQAGKYNIEKGSTILEIIKSLRTPINETDIQITFLEGWNIYDIDEYLESKGLISEGEFIKQAENIDFNLVGAYTFLGNTKTYEGFLYPDTYNINPNNFSVEGLINTMLTTFKLKVYDKLLSKYSSKEILDIVTLASIVEKEEKNSSNKSVVAGILKKRLDEGWMIGADITVCYPHKLTSEECKMVVSKYINEKSAYNTRTMIGLPETPIGNPSFETVNATINTEQTSYYFYLHDNKGNIYYAENNAGHEINKNNYLR